VKVLLDNGASANYRTPSGYTVLMKAVGSRSKETIELLLNAKANVDDSTPSGMTAEKVARTIEDTGVLDLLKLPRGS
jgi:ankyrin repeat protein